MSTPKKRITIQCTCNAYDDIQTPCCDELIRSLNDCSNHLHYSRKYRQYGIRRVGSTSITCIDYCPWCGKKLPKSLDDEWDEVLKNEYGITIDNPWDKKEMRKVPAEFLTDEWWKKRSL